MKNHINHTIKEIQHYLPSQMTLKDFIHHNSLHPFQKYSFYEGIFRASKLFGYKVTLQLGEFRELFALNRIKENLRKNHHRKKRQRSSSNLATKATRSRI